MRGEGKEEEEREGKLVAEKKKEWNIHTSIDLTIYNNQPSIHSLTVPCYVFLINHMYV